MKEMSNRFKVEIDVVEYQLMHKDRVVATVWMDEDFMDILSVKEVLLNDELPLGIREKPDMKSHVAKKKLKGWWRDRILPATRHHIKDVLLALGVDAPIQLLEHNFGLSLSDCYWARPAGREDLTWADLNFYENDFCDDLGYFLVENHPYEKSYAKDIDLFTPDGTTNGDLVKGWIISDGERFLLKRGYSPAQDANEVIASEICRRLGIPHAEYSLFQFSNLTVSASKLFTSASEEYIPMSQIIDSFKKSNGVSDYEHTIASCVKLGLDETVVRKSMEQILVVDYLLFNSDRHYGNFGLIRNTDTGEYTRMAPIFDTGSALKKSAGDNFGPVKELECKPYRSTHDKQILLVKDLSSYDLDALAGMDTFIADTYKAVGFDEQSVELKNALKIFDNQLRKLENLKVELSNDPDL